MGRTSDAKERLIETAVGLIRSRSYSTVSVDDLCRHAGVRKGSFYHFFPAKRDLALAALDSWWETSQREVLHPAFQPDLPPLQRIERAFQRATAQHARMVERTGQVQGCPLGNMALELAAQDEVMRERLDTYFGYIRTYFAEALAEAAQHGALARDADVATVAQSLVAYLYGAILLAKTANDIGVMRTLAARALTLVPTPN